MEIRMFRPLFDLVALVLGRPNHILIHLLAPITCHQVFRLVDHESTNQSKVDRGVTVIYQLVSE